MTRKFDGENLEQAVYIANAMFHDGRSPVKAIAKQLGCSWGTADKLIVYSQDKWHERLSIMGQLPLHFEDCKSVA